MSLLQNEDFKTEAQITGAGGTASQLLNDSKIWVTGNSINKTLDDAIVDGDIGGGGSGINYITNGDFKANANGWNTYKDADQATPVDGTSGTALGVTFIRTTTNPLRGTGSGLFSKAATISRRGEGSSDDFTIDVADQGKMLEISFDYKITDVTLTYADGDVRIYIYDVTNAQLIEPSQRDLLANSGQGKYIGYFQAASNSTSYRIIYHVATTTLNAYEIRIDAVRVGPIQSGNAGTFVSDWQSFTPTGSWTTNTTYTGRYRRVGDTAEFVIDISLAGAPNVSGLAIVMPLSMDSTKMTGATNGDNALGIATARDAGVGNHIGVVTRGAAANQIVIYGDDGADAWTQAVPITFGASDSIRIQCAYPVQGWSTGVSASEISSVSAVSMRASGGTTNFTGATTLIFPTKETDTAGAYNSANGEFTIPESGFYIANALVRVNAITLSTSQSISVLIYRNAVELGGSTKYGNGASITYRINASVSFYANKGDIITVKGSSSVSSTMNGGASDNFFTISKVSTPAQIAPTEFVGCSYETNAGQSIPNNAYATVVYEDRIFDTHSSMNTSTGVYTIPVSGNYEIYARLGYNGFAWTVGKYYEAVIRKNSTQVGAITNQAEAAATYIKSTQVGYSGSFVKGDTIDIQTYQDSGSARTLLATGIYNQVIIKKVS